VSAAEIIGLITIPLLAVVGQLQRLIPVLRADLETGRETREGVRALLRHFGITTPAPGSPAPSSPSSPR
jgi:hypothetical protein